MTSAPWTAALAVSLLAGVASASEVVAVRVGSHPTFTRVVFELDSPAGYRVERRELPQGGEALVVTLDAESPARSVRSRSVMVEAVELAPRRERTAAQIRLRKSPARIKELILTDPPRIVFDLVLPEPDADRVEVAEAPPAPSPPTQPEPEPSEPATTPAPVSPIARPAPEPPRAEPAVEEPAPEPAPSPVAPVAEAEPEPPPPAPATPDVGEVEVAAQAPQATGSQPAPPLPRAPLAPRPTAPEAEAAPERAPAPAPPRARTTPEPPAGAGWLERVDPMVAGAVAAGVLLVLLLVVVLLRRRGSDDQDIDVVALAEAEERQEAMGEDAGFAMGGNGGFAMDQESGAAPARPEPTAGPGAEAGGPSDLAAGPGLFDEDSEKESETMDSESANLPLERGAAAAGAAGDTDVVRLVRELERRVAQLETRLDESIDARQRLERQVAAQSEELRVQRTAIARTQRALRSLNRGEEEQATEPALREPSK